jgi:hypothetical protein
MFPSGSNAKALMPASIVLPVRRLFAAVILRPPSFIDKEVWLVCLAKLGHYRECDVSQSSLQTHTRSMYPRLQQFDEKGTSFPPTFVK